MRLAKAPPIIRDRLVACADGIELRAPHAAVANRGVQKDNGVAVADDLRSQPGLAGRNLMIGAHALATGAILVTNEAFNRIKKLKIQNWTI